ncbi:hypothetical protein I314_05662 [Cryptococcus bacillisporus CA1873]|uniref:Unplaced genomic scaffold supercont1.22, whole genome shotgun sequence n=2 Tax=Cryptococcus gattii TaxID=552467 RepID=A0A0D0U992_CRYGA|nr:hypothetical protein I312_06007 [Cryptococcus bacillisporus CA1280]KIR58418.1 hypothetical protein I314_05662 [Cryptococcus bacillisporus CA1873]|eukprot:KIR58418.1 hypothetical protein I314_05662 [Cryptococcus gattii CA1873]
MAQQQRYTPVPGMGPSGNRFIVYRVLKASFYCSRVTFFYPRCIC